MGRLATALRLPVTLWIRLLFFLLVTFLCYSARAQPGFISIDCGSTDDYTDDIGISWVSDATFPFGKPANVPAPAGTRRELTTLRYFPADNRKYCYTLPVTDRTRYLVRASFLYADFDGSSTYPEFDLSLGASHWWPVSIEETDLPIVKEVIFVASTLTVSVCVSNATTGSPFISSLELRRLSGSAYHTLFEKQYYLAVSHRINFGAESTDPVRFPDDPNDRIWQSDSIKRANYLVDLDPGTVKVSTTTPVVVDTGDTDPPSKVMQTAVVGSNGSLNFRLNLYGFPLQGRAQGWAFAYLAEIEKLAPNETRKFKLTTLIPGSEYLRNAVINVQENVHEYRLYAPGSPNISLAFVSDFHFEKTPDSTRGPILNAFEICKYLPIHYGSPDATIMSSFVSHYSSHKWAQEGGDPCLPFPWSWVQCNADSAPRITSITLSRRNLSGTIPSELTKLIGLVELWLDGNSLTGAIPDFSGCVHLKKIHLENNRLSGEIPSFFSRLQSLNELYVQNNMLVGKVPSSLVKRNIDFKYSGNMNLHEDKRGINGVLIATCVGSGFFVLILGAFTYCCLSRMRRNTLSKKVEFTNDATAQHQYLDYDREAPDRFTLSQLEEATGNFGKQVGYGGYGVVYYGKMTDGKEIAVKVLKGESYQGHREFLNEVELLSRIHHRNLVAFLGFYQKGSKNILVYEFMHNGSLKDHLYGPSARERPIGWLKRLQIAEDAAKGLEYLHTGCVPGIIHRDVKSGNILLDKQMRAKVSDFGLSKLSVDGSSYVSSKVRGTLGYLDPEYYNLEQLTDKSDVYSFGVVLLELISGQEPISNERFGNNCRYIVKWAQSHIAGGDIQAIIDPSLWNDFNLQSIWKIAELAISCVQPLAIQRPKISDVLREIQEALLIEQSSNLGGKGNIESPHKYSTHSSFNVDNIYLGDSNEYTYLSDSAMAPVLR